MAYVDLTARFSYKLALVFGDHSKLANNDAFMKDNGWQDGTVGVFFQAAAPTGWTKQTTVNASAIRVVSGFGGGVGGSFDPATTITLAHTHVIDTDAAHTHALGDHNHSYQPQVTTTLQSTVSDAYVGEDGSGFLRSYARGGFNTINQLDHLMGLNGSFNTGSGGSHNHGGVTDSKLSDVSLAYVNVLFCSKDTSSGYTDLTLTFVHDTREVFDYFEDLAQNDNYNFQRSTPASTVSLFGSVASPTGWTKVAANHGTLPRVVSATGGGTGGAVDLSATITLAHTHADLTSDGAHTHTIPNHQHKMKTFQSVNDAGTAGAYVLDSSGIMAGEGGSSSGSRTAVKSVTDTDGAGTSSSNGAHQHTIGSSLSNVSLAYLNVIQASKDSAGAPAVYTDMRGFFVDQALLAYQDLQKMANNDAYLYYHTMPSAAVMFFFQAAAPLNWTKLLTKNDMLVRIVSDGTGGTSGGSTSPSATITLAHTHSISPASHSHTYSHTHAAGEGTVTANAPGTFPVASFGSLDSLSVSAGVFMEGSGSSDKKMTTTVETQTVTTDTYTHSHGGATESALSNIALAYADAIMCQKN